MSHKQRSASLASLFSPVVIIILKLLNIHPKKVFVCVFSPLPENCLTEGLAGD